MPDLRDLLSRYLADERVLSLRAAAAEAKSCTVGAVHGGLAPLLLAALLRGAPPAQRPRLAVTGDPETLVDDLEALGIACAILPELDEFEDASAEEGERSGAHAAQRVAALEQLARGTLLVCTPHAAEQPVPALAEVARQALVLRPGDTMDLGQLAERLADDGYSIATVVEKPGQLALRGGILDVYPLAAELPYRIEFFGDDIESVRIFDAFTQEGMRSVEAAHLTTRHGLTPNASLWQELPPGPIVVLADVALAPRLRKPHGRAELRLARQLDTGAVDGASVNVERYKGDLQKELAELTLAAAEGEVLLLARNDESGKELAAHLGDHGLGRLPIATGRLSCGFRDLAVGLVVVHDYELAHRRPAKRRKNGTEAKGAPLANLTDLKNGDYVVHIDHGIARFRGMATLQKRGWLEDFLLLEFAEEAKLYLPVTGIDLVQKYIGGSGRHPELGKLGGAVWKKKRDRAQKAIEDLAADLLASQAAREQAGGISYPPDSPELRRFETAFPFEETEDQLAAAREIKADMERPRGMDRLLCGDVGFGKTEVAMRAAYKAVCAGYQVAVLAPTTLLAEQHARSFDERMGDAPVGRLNGKPPRIACLDRFRTGGERRDILEKTKQGDIDILIGTHALLTEELSFINLGLLVVDEEHRFGVKHKEKMKAIRAGVDVLTLSATPIPRTLHFSMTGLREISVLAEAPANRLAVQTRVASWDRMLIRGAIERELARQGQVFFVHNKVQDIDHIADRLTTLVPGLRLGVIHGQMAQARIASTMHAFAHGGIDCLLATSIVESGIDIPNANTLFVNNAHCFGLSELHQLRGRIGRFTRQAHAYFLIPSGAELNEEAKARLDAIEEYSELGAGFKLAMRDLEIRGAGNLLGAEQSGHIDAIGYELYLRLLGDTVRRLGGSGATAPATTTATLGSDDSGILTLPLDAFVPDEYIDSPALKFELHKSIEGARRVADLAGVRRGIADRYGAPPPPVRRLLVARGVRLRCKEVGITRIELRERQIRLALAGPLPAELARAHLPELIHVQPDPGGGLLLFTRLDPSDRSSVLGFLARLLGIDTAWLDEPGEANVVMAAPAPPTPTQKKR